MVQSGRCIECDQESICKSVITLTLTIEDPVYIAKRDFLFDEKNLSPANAGLVSSSMNIRILILPKHFGIVEYFL